MRGASLGSRPGGDLPILRALRVGRARLSYADCPPILPYGLVPVFRKPHRRNRKTALGAASCRVSTLPEVCCVPPVLRGWCFGTYRGGIQFAGTLPEFLDARLLRGRPPR